MDTKSTKRVYLEEIGEPNELILEALEPLLYMSKDILRLQEDMAEIKSSLKAIRLACYTVS